MDVEKTMAFILQTQATTSVELEALTRSEKRAEARMDRHEARMDRHEARMDRFDRSLEGTAS
jgi:hypothetical protein